MKQIFQSLKGKELANSFNILVKPARHWFYLTTWTISCYQPFKRKTNFSNGCLRLIKMPLPFMQQAWTR